MSLAEPQLPAPGEQCPHCGYYHHKLGGHLKWYVGALVCPVYVSLVLEDLDTWGVRSRRAPSHGRERQLARCGAPGGFKCFHKGDPDKRGVRRCYSPDGFTTEVPEESKLLPIHEHGHLKSVELNERLMCPHIESFRRAPTKKSGRRARSHGSAKGSNPASFNEMPGSGDPRKQAVYTEVFSRVEQLKSRNERVTPKAIAALGGKAGWQSQTPKE